MAAVSPISGITKLQAACRGRIVRKPFNRFIRENHAFFAHCIVSEAGAQRILREDGRRRSSEERFRLGKKVTHENVMAGCSRTDYFPAQQVFDQLGVERFQRLPLPGLLLKYPKMIQEAERDVEFFKWDRYRLSKHCKPKLEKLQKEWKMAETIGLVTFPQEGIAQRYQDLQRDLERFDFVREYDQDKEYFSLNLLIDLANTQIGSSLDQQIARYLQSHDEIRGENAAHLYNLRTKVFGLAASGLRSELRYRRNTMDFRYGSTAILAPMKVLGSHHEENDCFGKPPFENGGEFYSLDLRDRGIVILGKEAVVGPFKKKYPNIVTYDELTEAQKRSFAIPSEYLDEGVQRKIKRSREPLAPDNFVVRKTAEYHDLPKPV